MLTTFTPQLIFSIRRLRWWKSRPENRTTKLTQTVIQSVYKIVEQKWVPRTFGLIEASLWCELKNDWKILVGYSILHPVNTDMRLDRPHWQCYCFSSEGYSLIKVWENDTLHISWMIDLCSYHKCKVTWEALGTPWFYSEHHNESFSAIDIEVWLQGCSKIPKQLCGSLR